MAFGTASGGIGNATSSSSSSSLVITTSAIAEVGNLVVVGIAKDNTSTVDGDNGEVTSVVDSAGNTYTKLREFTNGQGGAAAGATISVWATVVTTQLASGGTITANFAACNAKVMSAVEYTVGNAAVHVEGFAPDSAVDAAELASMTISGMPSAGYLFLRFNASEVFGGTYVTSTNYTLDIGVNVNAGTEITSMRLSAERRFLTATGDTSAPTLGVRDHASVYLAIAEGAGGGGAEFSGWGIPIF